MDHELTVLGEIQRSASGDFVLSHTNELSKRYFTVTCANKEERDSVYNRLNCQSNVSQLLRGFVEGQHEYVLLYDVSGISLRKYLLDHSSKLVHQTNYNSKRIMGDNLKHIIRDLIFTAIFAVKSNIKLRLTLDDIYILDGDWPYLEAIGTGTFSGEGAWETVIVGEPPTKEVKLSVWNVLDNILVEIFGMCKIDETHPEVQSLRNVLKSNPLPSDALKKLHSPIFWTKEIRMSALFYLGEIVEATQCITSVDRDTTRNLSGWRAILKSASKKLVGWRDRVKSDILLNPLETAFSNNERKKAQNRGFTIDSTDDRELNALFFFLRWTMLHFEVMKKSIQCAFSDQWSLLLHYEINMPEMMEDVYTVANGAIAENFIFFGDVSVYSVD